MNRLKKFWITFLSFLPFSAGAVAPIVVVAAVAGKILQPVLPGMLYKMRGISTDLATAPKCWIKPFWVALL